MKLKINEIKETPEMRKLRIVETENGRKFREKHIVSKKVYNRKSKDWTFSFLLTIVLQIVILAGNNL